MFACPVSVEILFAHGGVPVLHDCEFEDSLFSRHYINRVYELIKIEK